MRRANLFTAEVEYDAEDPGGYEAGTVRLGPTIGAAMLGGTI